MRNEIKNPRLNDLIGLLAEITNINSGSGNIEGVNEVQNIVARECKALGLEVTLLDHPQGSHLSGKLLIATHKKNNGPYINLVTHADTVFDQISNLDILEVDLEKEIAKGPGVIDDKGSIVVVLEGLRKYLKSSNGNLNFRFICTPTEELGSPGFQEIFQQLSEDSWMVLGFEPSFDDGSIIESRRGNRWYDISVLGIEGHPGRDHARGVNAATELAFKITKMHELTDYNREITVSTGQILGGSKFNIICGEASAKVDVRFSNLESRAEVHSKIEDIIHRHHIGANGDGHVPSATYRIADDCPPFSLERDSVSFLKKYMNIIGKLEGREVKSVKSGGASDSNYFSRKGLIIIDGLGATGGGMHSNQEFIHLNSLFTRSEGLSQFLQYLEQENHE